MAKNNSVRSRILVIAGSDSSGGAGLQRDLSVLASQGVDAACVVTAVTAQSNSRVRSVHLLPPALIAEQFAAATEEPVDAIKIGMLGSRACVQTIAEALASVPTIPVVLDPVLASSSGRALLEPGAIDLLRESLCPRATLVTPNLGEAALLLGTDRARTDEDCARQATELAHRLHAAVLLKGGHATGELATDLLAREDATTVALSSPRLAASMRGTGCALASLIAAALARGLGLEEACREGKSGVTALLQG